jgi:hypothetical protein
MRVLALCRPNDRDLIEKCSFWQEDRVALEAKARSAQSRLSRRLIAFVKRRQDRHRGHLLAKQEVAQHVADLLCFSMSNGTPKSEGYHVALKRLYWRVAGEQWQPARSAYVLGSEAQKEIRQIKGHVEDPVRCINCGKVMIPDVSVSARS